MIERAGHAEGRWSNGKKLLVVEDDEATRLAFTLFLEGMGYTVAAVENGQEALDHLRQNSPPSVILLDLMMPLMDGYEFRRAQRNDPALASIPVIVLSVLWDSVEQTDLFGDVGCAPKPVDADVLLATIQRFTPPTKPEILVVEDESEVLKMLDVALRHYGF